MALTFRIRIIFEGSAIVQDRVIVYELNIAGLLVVTILDEFADVDTRDSGACNRRKFAKIHDRRWTNTKVLRVVFFEVVQALLG